MIARLIDRGQQAAFLEQDRRWASRFLPPFVLGLGLVLFGGELTLRLGIIEGALERVLPFAAVGLGLTALTWAGLRQGLSLKLASLVYFVFAVVVTFGALLAGAADVQAPGATLTTALILSVCLLFTFSPSPYILPLFCLGYYGLSAPAWAWLGGAEVPWDGINKSLVSAAVLGGVAGGLLRLRRRQVYTLSASLRRQANEDPLTGLPNRAHAFMMGEVALKRARREGKPISLLLLDLDNFQAVNDGHGQPVGDGILQAVASLLRAEARPFDIIGRVGGDEFAWIMPGLDAQECLKRGAAFAARLRETGHRVPAGELGVTISGGCVELGTRVEHFEAALLGADEALHQAKAQGRDRLCLGVGRPEAGRVKARPPLWDRPEGRPSIDRGAGYFAIQSERTIRYIFWFSALRGGLALWALGRELLQGVTLEVLLSTHMLVVSEAALFALFCLMIFTKFAARHLFFSFTAVGATYNILLLGRIFDGPGGESAWFVTTALGLIFVGLSVSGLRMVLPLVLGKVLGTLPLFLVDAQLELPPSMIILYFIWVLIAAGVLYWTSETAAYRRYWLIESLRGEATVDPLTEVFNRRRILELAHGELVRAKQEKQALTVLVLDIDYFKSINESFGHDAGDEILKTVAKELLGAGRVSDPVGRTGGEEFLILLPGCDSEGAVSVAERILKRVSGRKVLFEGILISSTLSIGIATLEEGEDLDGLLRRGNEALDRAKEGGRNRYTVSETDTLPLGRPPALAAFPLPSHA